ncbi:hypothetical protein [Streptomyces sp. WZ.A104]|uniref:hypothetical protein n=1 Tax=Streptomyces sp. WZ.A104 TaxID=2023771 RepID=UPI0015C9FC88|nr:hypothetical protein [Streptomyces sp. WZ.A104]
MTEGARGTGTDALPAAADGVTPGGVAGDGAPGDGVTPEGAPAGRPPLLRRLLRSRTVLAATAAGLVGALFGAGAVAWRMDTLPLLSPAPCWGAFDDDLTTRVFGDLEVSAETQRLQRDPRTRVASYGQCRITSHGEKVPVVSQLTVRVRELDGTHQREARSWTSEFLQADMAPMGNGLPGMASASRAWLALPQSCVGAPDQLATPTVVDLAMGETGGRGLPEHDLKERGALSAAAVAVANGVLRELGCSGTYGSAEPTGSYVAWEDTTPDALCGIKGLRLPAGYRESLPRTRVGQEGGAARSCEVGSSYPPGELHLTTVVDPQLAHVFALEALHGGTRLREAKGRGPGGFGSLDVTRGVYVAHCQTGDVVFLVERLKSVGDGEARRTNLVRALLPRYVEAEAERIGCGPVRLTLPELR